MPKFLSDTGLNYGYPMDNIPDSEFKKMITRLIININRDKVHQDLVNQSLDELANNICDFISRKYKLTHAFFTKVPSNPARYFWLCKKYNKKIKNIYKTLKLDALLRPKEYQ